MKLNQLQEARPPLTAFKVVHFMDEFLRANEDGGTEWSYKGLLDHVQTKLNSNSPATKVIADELYDRVGPANVCISPDREQIIKWVREWFPKLPWPFQ